MLSVSNPTSLPAYSDQEEMLQLAQQICPKDEIEPPCAYRSFCDCAITDSSIKQLASDYRERIDAPTTDIKMLRGWAEQFRWKERLREWKPIHQAFRRQLEQRREIEILKHWNDRRQKFLDTVDQLLTKAELMLRHPHIEKLIYDEVVASHAGQIISTSVVIKPTRWQASDIAAYQKAAMALLQEVVGDRGIMIDRLTSDGFIITDPSSGEENMNEHLAAIERLEELQQELY